ncbi:MAG: ferritin-like domain-containing protein, partial [Sedimenticola sp.]|nr:ferritin-like domain-containing protein [Sedimenticola sp.]
MNTLFEEAKRCFLLADPDEKLEASRQVVAEWDAGNLSLEGEDEPIPFSTPGRLERPLLVPPQQVSKRGFGSVTKRASLIHSLAHIELTAVNLAWDTIYR